jgi:hypothetical protein
MSHNYQEESDVSVEPDSDSDSEENRVVDEDEDREEDEEEEWEDIDEGDEAEEDGEEGNAIDGAEIVSNLVTDMAKMSVDESKLQEFCNDIFSDDSKSQFRGTQEIRKVLFVEGILTPFPLSVHS